MLCRVRETVKEVREVKDVEEVKEVEEVEDQDNHSAALRCGVVSPSLPLPPQFP
jgi:hypothetical protein